MQILKLLQLRPAHTVAAGFALAIAAGTLLLMMPAAVYNERLCFIDALFTATSATCVTGLIVVDTATRFTLFGQGVILALIQIGGLGIMTFAVSAGAFLGRSMNLGQQVTLKQALDADNLSDIRRLIRFIMVMTAVAELIGAVLLFLRWRSLFPATTALRHAVFHSVSAFCNAGFSTFSDSLMSFAGDVYSLGTISLLIIIGGLGFPVIRDLLMRFQHRKNGRALRVQTRLVLVFSALLIAAGALLLWLFEGGMSSGALFQSITARTAGFNTVPIGGLSGASILMLTVWMFIGASPGSTGGGIKTTTFAVVLATVRDQLRNRPGTEIMRRTMPADMTRKAVMILVLSLVVIMSVMMALAYIEPSAGFRDICFETVSAFGTVGLSTGLTPQLSDAGRLLITALMFIGRLGPLTMALLFAREQVSVKYRYAEERVMVG